MKITFWDWPNRPECFDGYIDDLDRENDWFWKAEPAAEDAIEIHAEKEPGCLSLPKVMEEWLEAGGFLWLEPVFHGSVPYELATTDDPEVFPGRMEDAKEITRYALARTFGHDLARELMKRWED